MAKDFELLSAHYKSIEVVPGSDVVAGEYATSGSSNGFYLTDVTSGELGTLIVEAEIVKVVKTAAQTWAAGIALYVITATGVMTTSASGNTLLGVAQTAAESADTVGYLTLVNMAEFLKL